MLEISYSGFSPAGNAERYLAITDDLRLMKANPFLEVILAVMIMGSSGVFIKWMQLPPLTLSFFRLAVPASLLFIYFSMKGVNLFRYPIKLMLTGSVLNALRIFLFITAFSLTSISNAVIILYSWPVFATIFSMLFLKEEVPRRNLLLLILPIIGILLLFIKQPFSTENDDFVGMTAMLFSGIVYSLTIIIFKKESHKYNGFEVTFFQNLAGAFIFLPFFLLHDFDYTAYQWSMGIFYSFLIGIIAFGLFFSALGKIKASTVSFMTYLEVLVAISYGILLFDEKLSWNVILGGSLIIISVLLLKKK
jgi:drug/metabolite transporter (DMT)-like permease